MTNDIEELLAQNFELKKMVQRMANLKINNYSNVDTGYYDDKVDKLIEDSITLLKNVCRNKTKLTSRYTLDELIEHNKDYINALKGQYKEKANQCIQKMKVYLKRVKFNDAVICFEIENDKFVCFLGNYEDFGEVISSDVLTALNSMNNKLLTYATKLKRDKKYKKNNRHLDQQKRKTILCESHRASNTVTDQLPRETNQGSEKEKSNRVS